MAWRLLAVALPTGRRACRQRPAPHTLEEGRLQLLHIELVDVVLKARYNPWCGTADRHMTDCLLHLGQKVFGGLEVGVVTESDVFLFKIFVVAHNSCKQRQRKSACMELVLHRSVCKVANGRAA